MYNSNFERYSLRANNDYQVNDRLKLGLNIAPTLQIKNNQNTDGGWQILSAAFLADPTVNPYDENGEPILLQGCSPNLTGYVFYMKKQVKHRIWPY